MEIGINPINQYNESLVFVVMEALSHCVNRILMGE